MSFLALTLVCATLLGIGVEAKDEIQCGEAALKCDRDMASWSENTACQVTTDASQNAETFACKKFQECFTECKDAAKKCLCLPTPFLSGTTVFADLKKVWDQEAAAATVLKCDKDVKCESTTEFPAGCVIEQSLKQDGEPKRACINNKAHCDAMKGKESGGKQACCCTTDNCNKDMNTCMGKAPPPSPSNQTTPSSNNTTKKGSHTSKKGTGSGAGHAFISLGAVAVNAVIAAAALFRSAF